MLDLTDKNFVPVQEFKLPPGPKEGWGLTHDSENLILSDGCNHFVVFFVVLFPTLYLLPFKTDDD